MRKSPANQSFSETNKSIAATLPNEFYYHSDAAHGWLEVPYQALVLLQIQDQISAYSYRDGNLVYLEEDMDAVTFVNAYLIHCGRAPKDYKYFNSMCKECYDGNSSFIRNFRSFYR